MTDIEAVKRLHRYAYREEILISIQALGKQIPKKPTYEGDSYSPDGTFILDEWLCPSCGKRYEIDYDYCPNCGQKLDWSDKK